MEMLSIAVLKDENAPAIALLAVALKQYGMEACQEFGPELLRLALEDDFDLVISDLTSDKLNAALTILTTEHFEEQWEVFNVCSHLLNGIEIGFDDFVPLEPEYLASAMAEVQLLREGEVLAFSDEVRAFAGVVLSGYGLSQAPTIFPTAIMPVNTGEVDGFLEKDEALLELFEQRTKFIKEYMQKLQPA